MIAVLDSQPFGEGDRGMFGDGVRRGVDLGQQTGGGKLEEVTNAASLGKLDWTKVQPGDVLAINGVHVVAYLGDGQCIDSDPLQGGVAEVSAETLAARTGDMWFNGRVRVERWVK